MGVRHRRGAHLGLAVVAVDVGDVAKDGLRVARVVGVDLVDRLLGGRCLLLKQLAERRLRLRIGGLRVDGLATEALEQQTQRLQGARGSGARSVQAGHVGLRAGGGRRRRFCASAAALTPGFWMLAVERALFWEMSESAARARVAAAGPSLAKGMVEERRWRVAESWRVRLAWSI